MTATPAPGTSGGTARRTAQFQNMDVTEIKMSPPPPATREGWDAFDAGWSRFSNPYPAGTPDADHWLWAWQEAEGHAEADRALAAGADPEDYA